MEQKVLEKIVIDTAKTIYAFFLKRNVAENDAKDLTSETILSILQATQKILNEEAIYGYIFNTASNIYKKYLNNKKNHVFVPINENDFIENSTFIKDEQLERLHRELAMLPSLYRQCTILYYYQQYGLKEISEKLNISLEMTKYYLFKTRKTLKEGIVMERKFGQRSYNPETFYFVNFYYSNYNEDLSNLFNRKICGNILLACYYMPMSALDLAIELGVATVYIEDEIQLLLKYNLLVKDKNKYQTNWLILTKDFQEEVALKIKNIVTLKVTQICQKINNNIETIK